MQVLLGPYETPTELAHQIILHILEPSD